VHVLIVNLVALDFHKVLVVIVVVMAVLLASLALGASWRAGLWLLWAVNALAEIVCIFIGVLHGCILRALVVVKAQNLIWVVEVVLAIESPHVGLVAALFLSRFTTKHIMLICARRRRQLWAWVAAWRQHPVNVKVRDTTHLLFGPIRAMPCADCVRALVSNILIAIVISILINDLGFLATDMASDITTPSEFTPIFNDFHHLRILLALPMLILQALHSWGNIVNLRADLLALHVHRCAVLIVAIFSSTIFEQLLRGGLFKHHIHVAFDLLSGRPIDLAVLLQALLCLVGSLEF
jgi:hypothetical protein